MVAVSVDPVDVSRKWADEKGFEFPLASDPELRVIRGFGLENPDVEDLSLHAIYIVDRDGKIFYRKVARRRAYSPELIDAIDYHYARGEWSAS